MARTINYWWVTRPKRKLNSIPEVLAAFSNVALSQRWYGTRNIHIAFEEELERSKLKKVGTRRDRQGSGGRTYQAWLFSLGLIFFQEKTGIPYLTLAGEAIMSGKPPVEIIKNQVLKYQFPSPFGLKTRVSDQFRVHPFIFMLRLLKDQRIRFLTQEEIAKVVMTEGVSDSDKCFEYVIRRLLDFREKGDKSLPSDFAIKYAPSKGKSGSDHPFNHLMDVANTMMNWLEYTRLVYRENGAMFISPECQNEVTEIINNKYILISRPDEQELFQRKYGLDPWHQKDTRNLLNTVSISSQEIEKQRIRQAFISLSIHRPITQVNREIINDISVQTGTGHELIEAVLYKEYPHGAVGGFLSNYYEMAFKGRDEATEFEIATANIFRDFFGYKTVHLGQKGKKSVPDVLLVSDDDGYQAIIDNKAYSQYSISGDHHNRMVHNYIGNISKYSNSSYPLGFFLYIAGGFISTIDKQIKLEVDECHVPGSVITVGNLIKLIERHQEEPFSHAELRNLFGLNRQVFLTDFR